jgi:hypothetical protein
MRARDLISLVTLASTLGVGVSAYATHCYIETDPNCKGHPIRNLTFSGGVPTRDPAGELSYTVDGESFRLIDSITITADDIAYSLEDVEVAADPMSGHLTFSGPGLSEVADGVTFRVDLAAMCTR